MHTKVIAPVPTAAEKKAARATAKLAKEDAAKADQARLAANAAAFKLATGNDAPAPRATDKQVRAATTKAAQAVGGKPKHKPDPAMKFASKPTIRQNHEASLRKDTTTAQPETGDVLNSDGSAFVTRSKPKSAPAIPGTGYQGPMLALRERLKGYTKSANGQPSCGDEVANTLGRLEPKEVIAACLIAMDIANPYLHLNIGQQSMNLRNKLRGQLKRGEIGMGVLREAVEVVQEQRPTK